MKALRYYNQKDFRLEDIPEPVPGFGEVKVHVKCCGICGTDLHEYVSGLVSIPTVKPHPQTGKVAPIVGGHEFSGVVSALGAGVLGIEVGDRVAVRPTLPCYQCNYCRTGQHSQCSKLAAIGISADGAFSEYVIARQDCVVQLPGWVSFEEATYAEPLACGVHAVKRSAMKPGARVAVIGAGTIGLMTLQAALVCGAGAVYVFDPNPRRRDLAKAVGATAVFDPAAGDPGKELARLTENRRADVVIECAGIPAALPLANTLAGRGAVILSMGMQGGGVTLDVRDMFMREKSLVFSIGYNNDDYLAAVSFISNGRIKTDELLTTGRIPLADVLTSGFESLLGPQRLEHCKILVCPD